MGDAPDGTWTKSYFLTLNPHAPSWPSLAPPVGNGNYAGGQSAEQRRLAKYISDGIATMFSDATNFLEPGQRSAIVNGKRVFTGQQAPLDNSTVLGVRVKYQLEVGPTKRQLHAHIFVVLTLANDTNVLLKSFKPSGGRTRASAAWWSQFFGSVLAVKAYGSQQAVAVDPNRFYWHVQQVRPYAPTASDVINYLAKTLRNPGRASQQKRRRNNPQYKEPIARVGAGEMQT